MKGGGYDYVAGVGGIGRGLIFRLDSDHSLGRNESRAGELLEVKDYCKLHIILHYTARFAAGHLPVYPIGRVGCDAEGEGLLSLMRASGANCRFVEADPDRPTMLSVCYMYPNGDGGNITSSNSAGAGIGRAQLKAFFAAHPGRGLLVAAPEVPLAARFAFLKEGRRRNCTTLASFLPGEAEAFLAGDALRNVDILCLNAEEALTAAGPGEGNVPARAYERLRRKNPALSLIVTRGTAPVCLCTPGGCLQWPTVPATPISTAGAGDCLVGVLLAGLARGVPLEPVAEDITTSALYPAVAASAMSVEYPHSIHFGLDNDSLLAFMAQKGLL